MIGGAAPTGSVTFTLFGPGDATCSTPIATRTVALTGNTASSGPVPVGAAGTYNWMATYTGDTHNSSATSPCGSETVIVTAQTLTGRAYGLTASATLLGIPLVTVPAHPGHRLHLHHHVNPVRGDAQRRDQRACALRQRDHGRLPRQVDRHRLGRRRDRGHPGHPDDHDDPHPVLIDDHLRGIDRHHHHRLPQGRHHRGDRPTHPGSPNTGVTVGVVSLILNQQIPFTSPDNGLTVNAIHVNVNTFGLATVNVVIASSESDISNCP